jgi:hypothetical protein
VVKFLSSLFFPGKFDIFPLQNTEFATEFISRYIYNHFFCLFCTLSMFLFVSCYFFYILSIIYLVYLYLVLNLFNESDFRWQDFFLKINEKKWHRMKFIKKKKSFKRKITTKLLCPPKIIESLSLVVQSSGKPKLVN